MSVHVVGDTRARLSAVCGMLEQTCAVSSELLSGASIRNKEIDSIVVSADRRVVEGENDRVPKRIFLIEQRVLARIILHCTKTEICGTRN